MLSDQNNSPLKSCMQLPKEARQLLKKSYNKKLCLKSHNGS